MTQDQSPAPRDPSPAAAYPPVYPQPLPHGFAPPRVPQAAYPPPGYVQPGYAPPAYPPAAYPPPPGFVVPAPIPPEQMLQMRLHNLRVALRNGTALRTNGDWKLAATIGGGILLLFRLIDLLVSVATINRGNLFFNLPPITIDIAWIGLLVVLLVAAQRSIRIRNGVARVDTGVRSRSVGLTSIQAMTLRDRSWGRRAPYLICDDGRAMLVGALGGNCIKVAGVKYGRDELIAEFNAMLAELRAAPGQAMREPVDSSHVEYRPA